MAGHVARKGNRWYAIVYEGTDPATGRERRRWHAAGPDRATAEALADQLATAHARRRSTARGMTLQAFIHRYWLPGKQRQLRPTTLESYQRILRLHILPTLGHVALRDLRVDHAETLYTHLLSEGRHDGTGGLSAKSVHEVHMVLRAIGDHAVRHGLLAANPVRLATPPRFRRDHHRRRMAWTADELGHFLTVSRDHVHHGAFWVAAHTGMRRGELMALRWRDIDIPAARMTVSRTAVCVGTTVSESGGKTPRAVRTVDLDPTTLDVLTLWRQDQHDVLGHEPVGLFTKPDGRLLNPQTLSQAFERLVARTELPTITLHGLRHTHATLLLKAGVPLKVVSERLGHATPAFTMATYQHVLPGMQADAAATFAALVPAPAG